VAAGEVSLSWIKSEPSPKERLDRAMGAISPEDLATVEDGLRQILELG